MALPIYKVPLPVCCTTNVLLLAVAKSVKLAVLVLILPGVIVLELPSMVMVAVRTAGVVDPEITPPGLTQFEFAPLRFILATVPLLVPVPSVTTVYIALDPAGIPWLK